MDSRSNPCIELAEKLIEDSMRNGNPVWLHTAVHDILAEHPDCGLTEEELGDMISRLVIERHWSLAQ